MALSTDIDPYDAHFSAERVSRKAILAALVLLLLQVFASSEVLAQQARRLAPQLSPRIEIEDPPHWTVSAAWNGDQLVMVDALASELKVYAQDGSLVRVIEGLPEVETFRPSYIQAVEGRLLLEYDTAKFVWMNSAFEFESKFSLHSMKTDDGATVASTFQWHAIDSATMVTFSDVQKADQSWVSRFLWIELAADKVTSVEQIGKEIGLDHPMRALFLLGQPLLTAIDHSAVYLKLAPEQGPFSLAASRLNIERAEPGQIGARRLHDLLLPEASSLLQLPLQDRRHDIVEIYSSFDSLPSAVMGIYGANGRIHALIRDTYGWFKRDSPVWWIRTVDSESQAVRELPLLEVEAEHLIVVPGERNWAIIEKGPVKELGDQQVLGLRLLSGFW